MSPHSLLFFVLTTALTISPTIAGPALNVEFPTQPPASALVNVVEDNFIGISWELSSFDTLWGKSVDKQPTAMQNYLKNIDSRMSKPLRIRVGGNGMDGSTYVPDLTEVIGHVDESFYNDMPVHFGPAFFDVMNGMSDKVGPMKFSIGLSMRDPRNITTVVKLGVDARQKLGDKLDALMLGNEPDLYDSHGNRPGYNIATYERSLSSPHIPEVGNAIDALEQGGSIGNEPLLGGPTTCCSWNLDAILDAGLDKYPYKYYTLQHYPNNVCFGVNARNTNISYYLDHSNVGTYLGWEAKGMQRAQELNVPVVLSEFNSVACGGTNISSTFAMSLWTIDVGLKAASMNYSASFVHTREHGIEYNLFDPPTAETSTDPNWRTGSPYYGVLFLSETASSDGSVIVDLNLDNSVTSPEATVAAYGIYDKAGTTRGKLALMNFAADPQDFTLPSGLADKVQYRVLSAPDVAERKKISWAGQTVGNDGILEGEQKTVDVDCKAGCTVSLPGPGAALVFLGDASAPSNANSTGAPKTDGGNISGVKMHTPLISALTVVLAGVLSSLLY